MRKLIISAIIGIFLLFCAAPLFAQQTNTLYRPPIRFVQPIRITADSVCYRVLSSEASPTTIGRVYCATRKGWNDAKWVPYPGPIPELPRIDTITDQPQPEPEPVPEPQPQPDPPNSEYPNRPAGLTLIGRNDGSVKESGGHAFGIADFGAWFDHNRASDIAVIDDPTNPAGSGKSLRITLPSDDSKAGSANAQRFTGGPYREVYVLLRVLHESGFRDHGNKYFYLGAQSAQRRNTSSPTQFYLDRPAGGSTRLRVVNQNGTSNVALQADNAVAWGRWQTLEFHFLAESSPGAGDGRARMWIDGRQVAAADRVAWNATAFDGMQWYAEVNRVPTTSIYRIGELYIAGRK